jgi:uncharacterized protein (DUF924 family)
MAEFRYCFDEVNTGEVGMEDLRVTDRREEILDFWFAETPRDAFRIDGRMTVWFGDDPSIDKKIASLFSTDIEKASNGELEDWAQTPRGRLALIILLDQFRRNIYRHSRKAFLKDHAVLKLTIHGMEIGHDRQLEPIERAFFYMPMQHSESLKVQEFSVRTFSTLAETVKPTLRATFSTFTQFAELHRDIVAQFGRFPHRNAVLGRKNTPEEEVYLDQGTPNFGQG